jgi:hypothetical protein
MKFKGILMTRVLFISASMFFVFASFFFSCKKDDTIITNNIHDTICPVQTRTEQLASKDWIVDHIERNISGTNSTYVRGGVNTTGVNYANMRFHFNSDGTGTYIDEVASSHTLNWNFTTSDQREIAFIIGPPFPTTFNWKMFEISGDYIHVTTPVNHDILVASRLIKMP